MAGKQRFHSLTELMDKLKRSGSKGGKNRAKNLTSTQHTEIGKKGAAARWGKKKSAKAKTKRKEDK